MRTGGRLHLQQHDPDYVAEEEQIEDHREDDGRHQNVRVGRLVHPASGQGVSGGLIQLLPPLLLVYSLNRVLVVPVEAPEQTVLQNNEGRCTPAQPH